MCQTLGPAAVLCRCFINKYTFTTFCAKVQLVCISIKFLSRLQSMTRKLALSLFRFVFFVFFFPLWVNLDKLRAHCCRKWYCGWQWKEVCHTQLKRYPKSLLNYMIMIFYFISKLLQTGKNKTKQQNCINIQLWFFNFFFSNCVHNKYYRCKAVENRVCMIICSFAESVIEASCSCYDRPAVHASSISQHSQKPAQWADLLSHPRLEL